MQSTDALIIVDVQNDFVSGSMAIEGSESIIPVLNALMKRFGHVVLAQDWHPPGHVSFASAHAGARHGETVKVSYGPQRVFHDHCVQGTRGSEFAPGLDLGRAELILRKGMRKEVDSFSAFYENDGATRTGLAEYLRARGVKRLYCGGLSRYGCVKATAEGARRDGFEVHLVEEASAGRESDDGAAMEKSLADQDIRWVGAGKIT
jgi:nicotinamidase/pyrazinamidase